AVAALAVPFALRALGLTSLERVARSAGSATPPGAAESVMRSSLNLHVRRLVARPPATARGHRGLRLLPDTSASWPRPTGFQRDGEMAGCFENSQGLVSAVWSRPSDGRPRCAADGSASRGSGESASLG